jgi:hypothetical protein
VTNGGTPAFSRRELFAVASISAALLMTELALTRVFSVVMYYHFAFLAISIALFGISASGVVAYVLRARLNRQPTDRLLTRQAVIYAVSTIVALFWLVRLRVGLDYSARNLMLMLVIYGLAAIPFFTGGLVVTLAISRFSSRISAIYAADLVGAAGGCVMLIPLLNRVGAPGVVLTASALALGAAVLFTARSKRARVAVLSVSLLAVAWLGQVSGFATFDVTDTKGHEGDTVLFSKWNSFSRIGVYERQQGDWSLSPTYSGPIPDSRFMDIDSAASTPILHVAPDLSDAQYLRYELTALAYHVKEATRSDESRSSSSTGSSEGGGTSASGFTSLVIGPGGGRDLVSALVFGAERVDGVEINPIIANDVMRARFLEFSGSIYAHPRVRIFVDDGRSYVRRTSERYDVIQASLVDTWAATAAGAYTLTENTLYTVEAFDDYLNHLTDDGVLTITRWVFDGLRLVSLAQEACEHRGWDAKPRLAIVQHGKVATFLLKKSPFSAPELTTLRDAARRLGFQVLYAPDTRDNDNEYARLIGAPDRERFYETFPQDVRPTTDDRPFFFHTTKLRDQFEVAFGRAMLFGNGLSALLTLMAISAVLVVLFVIVPLALSGGGRPKGWFAWILYFGALGGGFMLLEVAILQRFVLLLGHPVYSLTVTLFSLLLGTGAGAALSRKVTSTHLRRTTAVMLAVIALLAVGATVAITPLVTWAIPFSRAARIALAVATVTPLGLALGIPMPAGIRLLSARSPEMVAWAWGINGALSVVGATMAIFIAMNWGFNNTLLASAGAYAVGLVAFSSTRS